MNSQQVVNDLEAASQWATAHLVDRGSDPDADGLDRDGRGSKGDPDELNEELDLGDEEALEEEEADEGDEDETKNVVGKAEEEEDDDDDESSSDSDADSETSEDIRRKVALLSQMSEDSDAEGSNPSSAPRTANEVRDDCHPPLPDPKAADMAAKAGQEGIREAGVIKFHMVEDRTVVIER